MQETEYVTVRDIDRMIRLRKDTDLICEEDGEYKTYRVYFIERFGTLKNFMKEGFETIDLNYFSIEIREIMRKDNYEGKYVYRLVLEKGKVIPHYYTFMGIDEKKQMKVIPTKIPLENKFTVDPRKVINSTWYYLKSK